MSVENMLKGDRRWQKTRAAMKVKLALQAEIN